MINKQDKMLPHIQNSLAGRDRMDPAYKSIFEVYFTLPEALRADFGQDEALITEHVLSIEGLDALDAAPEAGEQKFMGTDRSYLKAKPDKTSADISVKLSINLRNGIDNYIYKLFKAWSKLNYDIQTGERSLKKDYTADWIRFKVGNRAGDVYRDVTFKDVFINGPIQGASDTYAYDSDEVMEITVKFRTDWWDDKDA